MKIQIVNNLDNNAIARVYYPGEIDKDSVIKIVKGLNVIEFSEAIHHEMGHLFDWYLSDSKQSEDQDIRELNADIIGECIRFRKSTNNVTKE